MTKAVIGILALQGSFAAHAHILKQCDASISIVLITRPLQLRIIDGLIIPGGESTALLKLMSQLDFHQPLLYFARSGKPVFGTCAGMILLAKKTVPAQQSLQLIDIDVQRNGYGRQVNSFIARVPKAEHVFMSEFLECIFIRAPLIQDYNEQRVTVLATHNEQAIIVQQDNILAASFHPELTQQTEIHHYFLSMLTME